MHLPCMCTYVHPGLGKEDSVLCIIHMEYWMTPVSIEHDQTACTVCDINITQKHDMTSHTLTAKFTLLHKGTGDRYR